MAQSNRRTLVTAALLVAALLAIVSITQSQLLLDSSSSWDNVFARLTDNYTPISLTSPGKYAYAFVIGVGDTKKSSSYRGYIYNILVSTRLLREFGSKADVVGLFMISNKVNETTLPDVDRIPLEALGVKIMYLSKSTREKEDFYDLQMRKFDILNLTQYSRVIHMDGDVMPLENLDFLFELSDGPNPILKENLVVSGPMEPSNGGFFMLAPGPGRLEELRQIIQRRIDGYKLYGKPRFDVMNAWGHKIEWPDHWHTRKEKGTNWTFHAAYADQGLLYHWVKYVRRNVTIVVKNGWVENWGTSENGTLRKEYRGNLLDNYSKPLLRDYGSCRRWMCDYVHFVGRKKPWNEKPQISENRKKSPTHLWWHTLNSINTDLSLGLNFSRWKTLGKPPLGYYVTRVG